MKTSNKRRPAAPKVIIARTDGPWKDGGSYLLSTNHGKFFIDNRIRSNPRGQVRHIGRRVKYGYSGYEMGRLVKSKALADAIKAAHENNLTPDRHRRLILSGHI